MYKNDDSSKKGTESTLVCTFQYSEKAYNLNEYLGGERLVKEWNDVYYHDIYISFSMTTTCTDRRTHLVS